MDKQEELKKAYKRESRIAHWFEKQGTAEQMGYELVCGAGDEYYYAVYCGLPEEGDYAEVERFYSKEEVVNYLRDNGYCAPLQIRLGVEDEEIVKINDDMEIRITKYASGYHVGIYRQSDNELVNGLSICNGNLK